MAVFSSVAPVAPHLVLELGVRDRWHRRVVVQGVTVLRELGRKVAQMLVHLRSTDAQLCISSEAGFQEVDTPTRTAFLQKIVSPRAFSIRGKSDGSEGRPRAALGLKHSAFQ